MKTSGGTSRLSSDKVRDDSRNIDIERGVWRDIERAGDTKAPLRGVGDSDGLRPVE